MLRLILILTLCLLFAGCVPEPKSKPTPSKAHEGGAAKVEELTR